jgi:hypothetical protein
LRGPLESAQFVSLAFDNSVAESFFATLKKELVDRRSWPEKAELRTEIFDFIEIFYNRRRRHSTLRMLSPVDYENSTLGPGGSRDAASRLTSNEKMTITPTAATINA